MMIGDTNSFGLKCELLEAPGYASDESFGHLAMWAGGIQIGEFERVTMLTAAADALDGITQQDGRRSMDGLFSASAEDAFATVYDAIFGGLERDLDAIEEDYEEFSRFLVCPNGIESFDGWIAILIEGQSYDRFIWRDPAKAIHEVKLASCEQGLVLRGFTTWVKSQRAGLSGS